MSISPILGYFLDSATNRNISVGVLRVLERNGNLRIAPNVIVLHAPFCAVDAHMLAVVIDPNRGNLRCSILHERSQLAESLLHEEIAKIIRNRTGHVASSL